MDALRGIAITAAGIGLLVLADFAPPVFRCKLEETGVRVRLFGWLSVASVPFDQIHGIERRSWLRLLLDGDLADATYVGGSLFRKSVVIWRATRGPLLIAPNDPDTFIHEVMTHVPLTSPAA